MMNHSLTDILNIKYPIIQAPMAGGITTTELVAAVSNNGGLGMIGAGYMTPDDLRQQIKDMKQSTTKHFGVNLFVPTNFSVTDYELQAAKQLLNPFTEDLPTGEEEPELPTEETIGKAFQEQMDVILEENIHVCSFTFGIPGKEYITKLKEKGILLIGTATTVTEAIENEKRGMDAVVVQGSEAGGHRGSFIPDASNNQIGLMALIPQVVDHINI